MDASTLHPECTLGRQTPVCRQLGHEAAFRADQGLRTRHGHRRLGNVVLSASLSRGPPMANHSMLWSPESNGYPTEVNPAMQHKVAAQGQDLELSLAWAWLGGVQ